MDVDKLLGQVSDDLRAADGCVLLTFEDGTVSMSTLGAVTHSNMAMGGAILLKLATEPFNTDKGGTDGTDGPADDGG